ncbi:MAG TPA: S26 family signal peptidase [Gemmataceae bacterium]|nr:S26 family signal peptidase [Gemmataceae bacterium]
MTMRRWMLLWAMLLVLPGCGGPWESGDRVLVTKCNEPVMAPNRYDVVVFKFPKGPVDKGTPKNYIKRLLGLPGEILAIFFGRVYHRVPEKDGEPFYNDLKNPNVSANDLWQDKFMHVDDKASTDAFRAGKFRILRKPPGVMMALRRIVYDNDFQPKDLVGKLDRWSPAAGSTWKADKGTGFICDGKQAEKYDFIRYSHLVRPDRIEGQVDTPLNQVKRMLILDTLDYNSAMTTDDNNTERFYSRQYEYAHWVGDLMLECNVDVTEPKGEFCLELSRGIHRFQACFDLATGDCSLYRLTLKDAKLVREATPMEVKPTRVKGPGSYMIRLANTDARLTVWVDRDLPFGDGKEYDPPEIRGPEDKGLSDDAIVARRGPTKENDFEPASIGSKGASVTINHIRLWRDIYYRTTASPHITDHSMGMKREDWSVGSTQLGEMHGRMRFVTMYVQPGHYLCLGDNSQASSDSREWGLVPQRLMLGRALAVYYPIERIGPIR